MADPGSKVPAREARRNIRRQQRKSP
jgi:hypothetical protein